MGLLSAALAADADATKLEDWLAGEAPEAAPDEVRELAELLASYLQGVPGALDALVAMTKARPYGPSVSFAAGQVLVYLLDEDDLFSEAEFGALGLLDDAYLIHACIGALRFTFPAFELAAAYVPPARGAREAVRALLPAGVADALDRTAENLVLVAAALYSGGGEGAAPPPPRAALRLGAALAAVSPVGAAKR